MIGDARRSESELAAALLASAAVGADAVEVRLPGSPAAGVYELTARLRSGTAGLATQVIVNDRMDVAVAAGAHGVHLGGRSLPLAAALAVRRRARWDGLIGRSVHSVPEALEAEAQGADYLRFGHVFASASHPVEAPRGLEALARVVGAVGVAVVAIGGIDASNVDAVLATGCSGVAVIGAVMAQADPARAAARLLHRLEAALTPPRVLFPRSRQGV